MKMKKYAASLVMFLLVQTTYVMELIPLKLSEEDDKKALRIAKLFNKYPKGYGETDQDKEVVVFQMKSFAQSDEYSSLYQRVKKYQKTLRKIEKQTICNFMYNYEDACKHHFVPEIRQKIFTNILYLCGDVSQYYAADNTSKFIAINDSNQFQDYRLVDDFRVCFLDEINRKDNLQLSFSNVGDNDELYPSDESRVASDIVINQKDNVYNPKRRSPCALTFTRKAIRELVSFLNAKQVRIEKFEGLFNNCMNDLSLKDQQKGLERFFQLSEQLKGHSNKRTYNRKFKGPCESDYVLLPLEEVFSTVTAEYDAVFYNQFAKSNDLGASRIEFGQENLSKFQKFPWGHRNTLADIKIKFHDKGRSFMDHVIIHVPLLINSFMPDAVSYYINDIALMIGCSAGTTAVLGVVGHFVVSYSMGEHIFPQVDAKFNSHMPSIKACIKEAKVRSRDKRGWSFFITHILHRVLSLAGNKLLSFQSIPIKICGGIMYVIRIPLHLITWCWVDCGDPRYHEYCARDLKEKPGD